jgi:hypothetical protein
MAAEREKMYECEVRRRRLKSGGGYEPYWKVKPVAEALVDEDTEFRCKDCHGPVKVLGRNGKNGTVPYVEHKLNADAEFCPSGLPFKKATDGREPRPSAQPVEFAPHHPQHVS